MKKFLNRLRCLIAMPFWLLGGFGFTIACLIIPKSENTHE